MKHRACNLCTNIALHIGMAKIIYFPFPNILFRDANGSNIMMDASALFPEGFHPVETSKTPNFRRRAPHFTRSECPPRYYYVDFGISRQYKPEDLPVKEDIILGGDKSPPEHNANQPDSPSPNSYSCDPFKTDIYFVGNMIRENFIKVSCILSDNIFLTFVPSDTSWVFFHSETCQRYDQR
jgi:hypothetical protein